MFVYLNQVMQTSCGSLPMGSLSKDGAGIALIKPHQGRPWDAQFILWHDIPFLTLSPEIRRFDLVFVLSYRICKLLSISRLYFLI